METLRGRAMALSFTCLAYLVTASAAFAHQVVPISAPDATNPAEVAVAINPTNPTQVVAASFQSARSGYSSFTYYSSDSGKTWTTVPVSNPRGLTQGDDQVAFGPDGTVYHSFLAFDGLFRSHGAENGIQVSRSTDGGATWQEPVPVIEHQGSVTPFEDKPALVVDSFEKSPHRGNVYISWTRFEVYGSDDATKRSNIAFSRSVDGGLTFSPPLFVSRESGDCQDGSQTVEGAVPAVAPDGTIYLVWAGPSGLVFTKSTDGGASFGPNQVIGPLVGGWAFAVDGLDRANGLPIVGVDLSSGMGRGTIYVNWVDNRNGDPDVFVISSHDGGETWGQPVRVNADSAGNGKAQFFTWMSVDPIDGAVNLVFYDRGSTSGTQTGVTVARSVDGGKTFANFPVDLAPFSTNSAVFFGDYTGISAYAGHVVAAFMDFPRPDSLALSAALFRFEPGTLNQED